MLLKGAVKATLILCQSNSIYLSTFSLEHSPGENQRLFLLSVPNNVWQSESFTLTQDTESELNQMQL